MTKINELTPEQHQSMLDYRAECLKIGLNTEPADIEAIRPTIDYFYNETGKGAPCIWRCESPMMAQLVINILQMPKEANLEDNLGANLRANLEDNLGANLEDNLRANLEANLEDNLRDNLGDNLWANLRANLEDNLRDNLGDNLGENFKYTSTNLWGSIDIYWIAFYTFPHSNIKLMHTNEQVGLLNHWQNLADNCFWWYPFDGICFVCDRPNEIHMDENGRLHNDSDMAVKFRDGWGVHAWHGRNIPNDKTWIITNPEKITAEYIRQEDNAEIRRIMLQRMDIDKYLKEIKAVCIDHDFVNQVALFDCDTGRGIKQLTVSTCHTTGKKYVNFLEGQRYKTAYDALCARYGVQSYNLVEQS